MARGFDGGPVMRLLAERGQMASRDVATHLGWGSRTAGPRMLSLELQGFVKRLCVKRATARSDAQYEWALTSKGLEMCQHATRRTTHGD